MAYSKGTGTPINADVKRTHANPARVGSAKPAASVTGSGGMVRQTIGVARKPAKNKAAK